MSLTTRSVLLLDAVASCAMGLLLLAAAPLADLLDLPATFLRVSGAVMMPWVAVLVILTRRPHIPRIAMVDVVILNVVWVVASGVVLASDRLDPNTLGVAFIVVQAIAVAAFALLQAATLSRDPHPAQGGIARA